MALSAILITRGDPSGSAVCIRRLGRALSPGDRIVVVDDGTGRVGQAPLAAALAALPTGRDARIEAALIASGAPVPAAVAWTVGLRAAAECAGVVLLDAAARPEVDAFRTARAAFLGTGVPVLVASAPVGPARDLQGLWDRAMDLPATDPGRRHAAAQLEAGGVLLFCRQAFLRAAQLGPDGAAADDPLGPLHWGAILGAGRLALCDRPVLAPRGRCAAPPPARAADLFRQAGLIRDRLPPGDPAWLATLLGWMLMRMEDDLARLDPGALEPYLRAALPVLSAFPAGIWSMPEAAAGGPAILSIGRSLAAGEPVSAAVRLWLAFASARRLDAIEHRLAAMEEAGRATGDLVRGLAAIQRFEALAALGLVERSAGVADRGPDAGPEIGDAPSARSGPDPAGSDPDAADPGGGTPAATADNSDHAPGAAAEPPTRPVSPGPEQQSWT